MPGHRTIDPTTWYVRAARRHGLDTTTPECDDQLLRLAIAREHRVRHEHEVARERRECVAKLIERRRLREQGQLELEP